MDDNERAAFKMLATKNLIQNCVILVSVGVLFYLTRSWLPFLLLLGLGVVKHTDDDKDKGQAQK